MYGVFTYIWLCFVVNVGKYNIHGSYGYILYIQIYTYFCVCTKLPSREQSSYDLRNSNVTLVKMTKRISSMTLMCHDMFQSASYAPKNLAFYYS